MEDIFTSAWSLRYGPKDLRAPSRVHGILRVARSCLRSTVVAGRPAGSCSEGGVGEPSLLSRGVRVACSRLYPRSARQQQQHKKNISVRRHDHKQRPLCVGVRQAGLHVTNSRPTLPSRLVQHGLIAIRCEYNWPEVRSTSNIVTKGKGSTELM